MQDVARTSPREIVGPAAVLPLVGTEADLGAVLIRMARMAAALHMVEAARADVSLPGLVSAEARAPVAAGSGA